MLVPIQSNVNRSFQRSRTHNLERSGLQLDAGVDSHLSDLHANDDCSSLLEGYMVPQDQRYDPVVSLEAIEERQLIPRSGTLTLRKSPAPLNRSVSNLKLG